MLVQLGVLYLWLANGAGGSLFVAVLGQAGLNAAGEARPAQTMGDVVTFFIASAATLVVIAATRAELRFLPADQWRVEAGVARPQEEPFEGREAGDGALQRGDDGCDRHAGGEELDLVARRFVGGL